MKYFVKFLLVFDLLWFYHKKIYYFQLLNVILIAIYIFLLHKMSEGKYLLYF